MKSKSSVLFSLGLLFWGFAIQASPVSKGELEKVSLKNRQKLGFSVVSQLTQMSSADFTDVIVILNSSKITESKLQEMSQFPATLPRSMRIQMVVDTLKQEASDSQADLVSWLNQKKVTYRAYYIMNAVYVKAASAELINALASRPEVKTIIRNTPVQGNFQLSFPSASLKKNFLSSAVTEAPALGIGPNISFIQANQVWEKFGKKGEGIVIAGQDTGVDWDHPALIQQYRGKTATGVDHRYSWHDSVHAPVQNGSNPCGFNSAEPCDDNAHGTHTVGTVVGDDGVGNQIGVAPGAKWIACRNMDRGNGTPQSYLECYEFFLAPYPQGGDPRKDGDPTMAPHVINNSWGCPESEGCQGAELVQVLQAIKAAGIMNVVSAGNDGPNCATVRAQPATISGYSFTVGAVSHSNGGTIANFSSRGPSAYDQGLAPMITAPGVNVRSSVPGGGFSGAMWSGTSMAGPHVVGAVALLWSVKPDLIGKIDSTIQKFTATATPKTSTQVCGNIPGTQIPNHTYGYGIVNALKAVETVK